MCESFNITVKTTSVESPWSNGLVERHMLDRVLEDSPCNMDIALAWCINANNSLQNVHGFSPYQLANGTNPILPSAINNRPPALTHEAANKTITTISMPNTNPVKPLFNQKIQKELEEHWTTIWEPTMTLITHRVSLCITREPTLNGGTALRTFFVATDNKSYSSMELFMCEYISAELCQAGMPITSQL